MATKDDSVKVGKDMCKAKILKDNWQSRIKELFLHKQL